MTAARIGVLGWSMRALVACVAGEVASAWFLSDGWESGSLAWLVFVVPLALAVPPVVLPNRGMKIAAAALAALWCVATIATVGLFFVPCALLMAVAAAVPGESR